MPPAHILARLTAPLQCNRGQAWLFVCRLALWCICVGGFESFETSCVPARCTILNTMNPSVQDRAKKASAMHATGGPEAGPGSQAALVQGSKISIPCPLPEKVGDDPQKAVSHSNMRVLLCDCRQLSDNGSMPRWLRAAQPALESRVHLPLRHWQLLSSSRR